MGGWSLNDRERQHHSIGFLIISPARIIPEDAVLKSAWARRIMKTRTRVNRFLHSLIASLLMLLALMLTGCSGGSSGSATTPVTQNPAPSLTAVFPLSSFAGSRTLSLTVIGSSFINGSVIQWNGASQNTIFISSMRLTAIIDPSNLLFAGTSTITVLNPAPGGGVSSSFPFTIEAPAPLTILTTRLPDAYHSKAYTYGLQASGGIPPYSWSIVGENLPSGLNLASDGGISGTPPSVANDTTAGLMVRVSDYASRPNTAIQSLNLMTRAGSLGRNDTCSTATPISNGIIRASISPYGDIDVYSFQGTAGNQATAEIFAQRLPLGFTVYLDSFLEILDSNCAQLTYNDDITPTVVQDSRISNYTLPYTGAYYIRVSDLRGDGRPDFVYDLQLSGAK
jgi:hypothetical protein